MHLLYDENGNPIPHGAHDEHHHHHEHHAAELDEMADKLEKAGMADAAKQIREGVSDFQKGNMRLSLALTLVKEYLKEVK